MDRVHNFSPGPSTLPLEVLEEVQREFLDYHGSGMSVVEMSHRGGHYEAIHAEALELARDVGAIPEAFDVLFVQGGATLQFAMAPLNLLAAGGRAGYVQSGSWARKALADAQRIGDAYVAWDGADEGFTRMPRDEEVRLEPGTRYVHVTSNETIEGVRLVDWPSVEAPLVADMSSDFFSRPVDWERFDLVYAGVQKNLAPAGMTVVVVRRSILAAAPDSLGSYLRYATHAEAGSLSNTPPSFSVYVAGKVLRWIKERGGLAAMQEQAARKAALLYDVVDSSDGYYRGHADPDHRSHMNVVFRLPCEDDEREFYRSAEQAGFVSLKGHRSVGGCRASIYNAMPESSVAALADFMTEFRGRRG